MGLTAFICRRQGSFMPYLLQGYWLCKKNCWVLLTGLCELTLRDTGSYYYSITYLKKTFTCKLTVVVEVWL